jgi:DNA-binding LacI/PurR family transcriptional regulator
MASIITFSLKQSDGSYLNLTASINDEANKYGYNVSVYETQTKEQRENKEPKKYVGNGRSVWTDGKIVSIPFNQNKQDEKLQTLL